MKKILGVFAFAVLLMAIDNFANAQNQSVTTVGNPDSNNLLIIEEGYQAVTVPVNAQPQNSVQPNTENNNMTTEGNVQVAPAPLMQQPHRPTVCRLSRSLRLLNRMWICRPLLLMN